MDNKFTKDELIIFLIIIFTGLIFAFFEVPKISLAGIEDNGTGWAWTDTVGWISFNAADSGAGGGRDYGIHLNISSGKFSGYAYSEQIGYISFNRADTGAPPSNNPCNDGTCIAKVAPLGQLGKSNVFIDGWARALIACDSVPCASSGPGTNTGGWDGWIRFDHGRSGEAYLDANYNFHGWAWDGTGIGWVSFNSNDAGAGGAAYRVYIDACDCTAWTNAGCGAGECADGKMRITRVCTPSGCEDESDCVPASGSHTDCSFMQCDEDNKCTETFGDYPAANFPDECQQNKDCEPTFWRWWEIVPR